MTRNEAIHFQTDAQTEPATFSPTCGFGGTLVLHGGGCTLDFGWYNVNMSSTVPPADSEIYTLVPASANASCTPKIGQTSSTFGADIIQGDARYQGGLIGFAIKGNPAQQCTQTHYSERRISQQYCPAAGAGGTCQ